jgi:hypothetical protein
MHGMTDPPESPKKSDEAAGANVAGERVPPAGEGAGADEKGRADVAGEEKPGTRWRSPDEPCTNCGNPTPGRYCPECGQRKTIVQVSVGTIVGEVLKDELALTSAAPRTAVSLLFRPGHLTSEYIRGRVVRYIPPLRLYLFTSILFFLVLSLVSLRALDRATVSTQGFNLQEGMDRDSVILTLRASRMRLIAADTVGGGGLERVVMPQVLAAHEAQLQALGDTVTPTAAARMPDAAMGIPGTLQPWAESVSENVQRSWLRAPVERKLAQIGHLPPRDAVRSFLQDMLDYAPHLLFLLLPVFALLLKLMYVRRDRYYAEHFVFALHVHAFFFLMFFIMLALPWSGVNWILALWMMAYMWVAMKRVYRQGWFRTTVKWWLLGWSYFILITFGLMGLVFSTLYLG